MPMSHPIYDAPEALSGMELNDFYQAKAVDWIQNNPGRFMTNGLRKILLLFHFDPMLQRQDGRNMLYLFAGLFPYGLMLPFIVLGMIAQIRNKPTWIFFLFIAYTLLLAFVFIGDSRIRSTIEPYLYIFGVSWITGKAGCSSS